MPTLAYFGINSSGLNLAIDLLGLFLVVLYASLVYWTYADARRRILDPMLVGCAVMVSLFPFVGTVVYIILRPPEYLEDVRERELEMQAAEVRLQQLDHTVCPHCDHHIERDFLRCPSCMRKLKERCSSCQRPLERTWPICPYCEAEVPGAAKARRPARTRERSEASAPVAATRASSDSEAQTDKGERVLEADTLREGETLLEKAPRARRPRPTS
jgi:Double zinc ribbon